MKLEFVAPTYDVAEKHLKYTKTLGGNQRLDIIAQPINPCVTDIPGDIEEAFGPVILVVTDLEKEDPALKGVLNRLDHADDTEEVWEEILNAAAPRIRYLFPHLKDDPRTAYFCPIFSEGGEGYRRGYVVAWEREDALDVAEFMAGGRAGIYLDLLDYNGEYLGGDLLGDISYSDVLYETDAYRRIVEGETLALAMETHLGAKAPEPEDPEDPGAELLETFTKLG